MAEVNNSAVIGNFTSRVTRDSDEDSAYGKLARYDKAMESPGHAEMHAFPASFFVWSLYILTTVGASSSGSSCRVRAPRPLTIWAADVGCESAGGATGTIDLKTDDGSTDASILNAAEDVKTAAGTCSRVAPEDGSEDVDYNTEIYITGASGGGGSLVGGQAHLFCQLQ